MIRIDITMTPDARLHLAEALPFEVRSELVKILPEAIEFNVDRATAVGFVEKAIAHCADTAWLLEAAAKHRAQAVVDRWEGGTLLDERLQVIIDRIRTADEIQSSPAFTMDTEPVTIGDLQQAWGEWFEACEGSDDQRAVNTVAAGRGSEMVRYYARFYGGGNAPELENVIGMITASIVDYLHLLTCTGGELDVHGLMENVAARYDQETVIRVRPPQ